MKGTCSRKATCAARPKASSIDSKLIPWKWTVTRMRVERLREAMALATICLTARARGSVSGKLPGGCMCDESGQREGWAEAGRGVRAATRGEETRDNVGAGESPIIDEGSEGEGAWWGGAHRVG